MQTPASHGWNFRLTFKLVHTFGSANEAGPGVNAERAANLFAPAARLVAQICGAATAVAFGDKETRSTFAVSSLSFLGLGKADGIPFRACFLQPVLMHKLLTQAALDSQLNNTSHKRRCIPSFSSLPRPIWTPLPRRRLRWKQAVFEVPAPRSMRQCASHRAHAHAVQWSDEEKLELEEVRDLRHRVRIEKRLLHNRTAPSLHKHVLGPFNEGTDLCCTVCEAHSAGGEFVKIPKGEMWRSSRLRRGAGPKGSTCKREAGPQTGARSQTQ